MVLARALALSYTFFLIEMTSAINLLADSIGVLKQPNEPSISASITNMNQNADYTFKFIPEKALSSGAQLYIDFPSQYASGLGLGASPTCSSTCTVSGRRVTVNLPSAIQVGAKTTVVVYDVLNPSSSGGTGSFILTTRVNGNIVGQNMVFGRLGIAPAVEVLSSASVNIMVGGSYRAGEQTYYDFKFKTGRLLSAGSWFKFTFPNSGFTIDTTPICTAHTVDQRKVQGKLNCLRTNDEVKVTGVSEDIQKDTVILIRVRVTNPTISATTGTFIIDTGREGTNTIYERATGISGVSIEPGLIKQVSLVPVDSNVILAKSKVVYYYLTFTTFNEVASTGKLKLIFAENFNPEQDTRYLTYDMGTVTEEFVIEQGLSQISYNQAISLVYDQAENELTISNFSTIPAGSTIKFRLRLTNPSTNGESPAVVVRTYDLNDNTIDENTEDATVTIADITGPSNYEFATSSNLQANGETNFNLQLDVYPNVRVPHSGKVIITIPNGMSFNGVACKVFPKGKALVTMNNSRCVSSGDQLTITLIDNTNAVTDMSLLPRLDNLIEIDNLVKPTTAGYYLFRISTYVSDGRLLESGDFYINFQPITANPTVTFPLYKFHTIWNILQFDVIAPRDLPTGVVPKQITDQHSQIVIELSNNNNDQIPYTSGSTIPCTGSTNSSSKVNDWGIICTFSFSNNINYVNISNFDAITKATQFYITFYGIMLPAGTWAYNFKTYIKEKNLTTLITSGTQAGDNLTTGTVGTVSGTAASVTDYSLNVTEVTSPSQLTTSTQSFVGTSTNAIKLIIHFNYGTQEMYCKASDSVTLTVAGAGYSHTGYCYDFAMAIVFEFTDQNTPGGTPAITINGLTNPSSVTLDRITYTEIDASLGLNDIVKSTAIPTIPTAKLTPGNVSVQTIVPSSLYLQEPNVKYTISFSVSHAVPNGGGFTVTFPIEFDLEASVPLPTCSAPKVAGFNGQTTCTIVDSSATLTNITGVSANSVLEIEVYGVKNPQFNPNTFSIYTFDANGNRIDSTSGIDCPDMTTNYIPTNIQFTGITAFPNNEKAKSNIEINFTLPGELPVDGIIKATFPAGYYGSFISGTSCRISGAANTFKQCYLQGRAVFVVSNVVIPSGLPITLHVNQITNPAQGLTSKFDITTFFDDTELHGSYTTDDQDPIYYNSTPKPEPITVLPIVFYPSNEAERATYKFTFTPSIDISTGQTISVIFPDQFAIELGYDLECWAEGLTGDLSCNVPHARVLDFNDFDAFTSCEICAITLYVKGVINPNYNSGASTGQFELGVRNNRQFTQLNEQIGTVKFTQSANLIDITSATVSNLLAREENTFKFNITTTNTIRRMAYGGALWVVFPTQQSIQSSTPYCKSSEFWASGLPSCEIDIRTVKISGQTEDYSGSLYIELDQLPNPLLAGEAGSIIIKSYDESNNRIIDSSFDNLHPTRFTYAYGGPEIKVNNYNAINVMAGTASDYIAITLDYPCALNMTVNADNENFSILPYNIEFLVGDLVKYFRVSVPAATSAKTYQLEMSYTNEIDPPFYTPLLQAEVIVTNTSKSTVRVKNIGSVPIGYSTMPITVYLDNAPNVELIVTLELINGYGYLSLSNEVLTFSGGNTELTFTINANADTPLSLPEQPKVTLSLSGANKHNFSLATSSFDLTLDAGTYPTPAVNDITIGNVQKNSAVLTVTMNNFGTLHCATALFGTDVPSFEDIKNKAAPLYATTKTMYYSIYTFDTTVQLTALNLRAETHYNIFCYLEDVRGRHNEAAFVMNFQTLPRYTAVYFSLTFNEDYINRDDETDIRNALEVIFSVNESKIPYKFIDTDGRRLQEVSVMEFFVVDDLENSNYPAPMQVASRINTLSNKFKEYIPYWDNSRSVTINEFTTFGCEFYNLPAVDPNSAYNVITVVTSLKENGYVYVTLQDPEMSAPSAFQIFSGTNGSNQPVLHGNTQVQGKRLTGVTFTDLDPSTEYDVFLTCGNDYPGTPQLKESTLSINWKTGPKPAPLALDLDSAWSLAINLVLVIALIVQ